MEELNIVDLLNYLKKRIIAIIIITLAGLSAGIAYTEYMQVPKYKSETTLLLLKAADTSDSYLNQSDLLMNQKLVTTYGEIIKSSKVLSRVITELRLTKTVDELNKMISVSSETDSILISITVTSLDSLEAKNIANTVAKVFAEEIQNLLKMQNVGIVDRATESVNPFNVKPTQQLLISALGGMFVGVTILFIVYYFDTTVKTSEQIEKQLGLPVIGVVPRRKRSKK